MSRVQPREPKGLDLIRRITYRSAKRMYGRRLEPTGVLAHHKPLLLGTGGVGLAFERYSRAVEHRYKHLAMLRVAQLIGCEWCLDFGSWLARSGGVPEEKLRELSLWRQSSRFEPTERLVLEYAEAMTRTPVEVTDELFGRLREEFDDRQMVELTMAIALENLYSRSNWALGIGGEGFSEGMYCVRPEASLEAVGAAR